MLISSGNLSLCSSEALGVNVLTHQEGKTLPTFTRGWPLKWEGSCRKFGVKVSNAEFPINLGMLVTLRKQCTVACVVHSLWELALLLLPCQLIYSHCKNITNDLQKFTHPQFSCCSSPYHWCIITTQVMKKTENKNSINVNHHCSRLETVLSRFKQFHTKHFFHKNNSLVTFKCYFHEWSPFTLALTGVGVNATGGVLMS